MKSKKRHSTEWEVCSLDEYGDIQDVEYFNSKLDAVEVFNDTPSPKQLWKTKWSFTEFADGETDDPNKDEQVMVAEA